MTNGGFKMFLAQTLKNILIKGSLLSIPISGDTPQPLGKHRIHCSPNECIAQLPKHTAAPWDPHTAAPGTALLGLAAGHAAVVYEM